MLPYIIPEECKQSDGLKEYILKNPFIKFVSLAGVDFLGNDTDERIPIEYFLKNMEDIFAGGVQTDGSSVNLEGIASLNDGKVDFVIDFERRWLIDYNYEFLLDDGFPVATIRIPIYFRHNGSYYCSRSVLNDTVAYIRKAVLETVKKDQVFLRAHKVRVSDIADAYFTVGTELEFWVRTPASRISTEELSVAQMLKESYWKRTKGDVRTGLEEALMMLQSYGLEPEMGHKEVGGIKGRIDKSGDLADVMEQLEIDWRFSDPMQAADNELLARIIIKEVYRRKGLEVTFAAKPVEGVAGSGEHFHIGMGIKLSNGKKINLFAPHEKNALLSTYGYGALMGLLKNWQSVNVFVTHSITALKRLKPGFEAPVSAVASLGHSPDEPSRNRTVLVGLVRSDNPLSVRFEIRAPNPHTNTYLAVSAVYCAMLEGIRYASGKTCAELHQELHKQYGKETGYLEKNREYCTEKNIFDDYSAEEREKLFGKAPATVWEIVEPIRKKMPEVFKHSPLTPVIIGSYTHMVLNKWLVELKEKEIPLWRYSLTQAIRYPEKEIPYDDQLWSDVEMKKRTIGKNDKGHISLITRLEEAIDKQSFDDVSALSRQIANDVSELQRLYKTYYRNVTI